MNKLNKMTRHAQAALVGALGHNAFKVVTQTFDHTNSTRMVREGHRMRTTVTVVSRQTGMVHAYAEAKVCTNDIPCAERGVDIAMGRALKQLEESQ